MSLNRIYDCSPRTATTVGRPRSVSASADEVLRLMPRGVRTALVPVAMGECRVEDAPDFALGWLQKHGALSPSKKAGVAWKQAPMFKTMLTRIAELYR